VDFSWDSISGAIGKSAYRLRQLGDRATPAGGGELFAKLLVGGRTVKARNGGTSKGGGMPGGQTEG